METFDSGMSHWAAGVTVRLGPVDDWTAYLRTMPEDLREEAGLWPLRRVLRPPDHLIEALVCDKCQGFIIALSDRMGVPYVMLQPSDITAAALTHMIRRHGYRPNSRGDVSRET